LTIPLNLFKIRPIGLILKQRVREERMSEEAERRSRTFSWEDPAEMVRVGKTMSGIAYLQAIQNGEVPPPPIAALMGMELREVSEGRVVFTLRPAEYHYNPLGTVHGGVAATLLDSAMGCNVIQLLKSRSTICVL
jgi:hypothetical protein